MEDKDRSARIHDLDDLELAVLLSLLAGEHCIIQAAPGELDDVDSELQQICKHSFGLDYAVIDCHETTSLEDLGGNILVRNNRSDDGSDEIWHIDAKKPQSQFSPLSSPRPDPFSRSGQRIANVLICKHANRLTEQIQIQILENFHKICGIHCSQTVSYNSFGRKERKRAKVIITSNHILLSHTHEQADSDFPPATSSDDAGSFSSVIRRSSSGDLLNRERNLLLSHKEIDEIRAQAERVFVSIDVKRYSQNIVVFLRLHRAVRSGITPRATRHLDLLTRCIAALHNLAYATPSLVSLAARKVYPHRITMNVVETERSMQWGGDERLTAAYLASQTPERIIEEVLKEIDVPL